MKKVEKIVQKIVFGDPAKGIPLDKPTFTTCEPAKKLGENEWYREFRVGSGHVKTHQGPMYEWHSEKFR